MIGKLAKHQHIKKEESFLPKFQLAIFDFNGTLTEEMSIVELCLEHYFTRFDLKKPSLKTYRQEITTDYMNFYYRHGIPGHITKKEMNEMRHNLVLANLDKITLQPGAKEIIEYSKSQGMFLAIVTGEAECIFHKLIDHLKLDRNIFDVTYTNAPYKTEIFKKLLNDFNVSPSNAYFIDDIESGIRQANSVGIHSIGVCNGFGTRATIAPAKPRLLADHLPRALEYIKVINRHDFD